MQTLIDDDAILVASMPVNMFQMNQYVIVDKTSGLAAIIDAGGEPEPFLKLIKGANATLQAIWQTHGHIDHILGLEATKEATGAPIYLHPEDHVMLERAKQQAGFLGIPTPNPPMPDHDLVEGQELTLGDQNFTVLFTPGHAPGHVCFYSEAQSLMFGGDLLFRRSIGRTDLPGCDNRKMAASLKRVAALPPETRVFPGHMEPTSIGVELRENPFLQNL